MLLQDNLSVIFNNLVDEGSVNIDNLHYYVHVRMCISSLVLKPFPGYIQISELFTTLANQVIFTHPPCSVHSIAQLVHLRKISLNFDSRDFSVAPVDKK